MLWKIGPGSFAAGFFFVALLCVVLLFMHACS